MPIKKRKFAEIKHRSLTERQLKIFLGERESLPLHHTLEEYCGLTKHNDIAMKLVIENKELIKEFMC